MRIDFKSKSVQVITFLLCVGIAIGAPLTYGWGKKLASSATPQQITDISVSYLSVYNGNATADVICLVNCDTNYLTNAIVNGVASIIPPGASFTFNTLNNGMITKFAYVSATQNTNVFISGF
jgi:hypothetical protein